MRVDTGRLRIVQEPRPGPAEIAVDDDAPLPGAYIQAQRKRLGLSLDQLAVATKIPRRQLEALEEDRYGDLPGLVFAKGFLRCCARALELDPDHVISLLYAREREQLRAKRRESSANLPIPPELARSRGNRVSRWFASRLDRLPSAQILMWLVVAVLIAGIVLVAFTLASGQASQTLQIRT